MTDRIAWLDGKELDPNQNAFGLIAQVGSWLEELGNNRATIKEWQKKAMNHDNAGMLKYITDTTGITFCGDDDE